MPKFRSASDLHERSESLHKETQQESDNTAGEGAAYLCLDPPRCRRTGLGLKPVRRPGGGDPLDGEGSLAGEQLSPQHMDMCAGSARLHRSGGVMD